MTDFEKAWGGGGGEQKRFLELPRATARPLKIFFDEAQSLKSLWSQDLTHEIWVKSYKAYSSLNSPARNVSNKVFDKKPKGQRDKKQPLTVSEKLNAMKKQGKRIRCGKNAHYKGEVCPHKNTQCHNCGNKSHFSCSFAGNCNPIDIFNSEVLCRNGQQLVYSFRIIESDHYSEDYIILHSHVFKICSLSKLLELGVEISERLYSCILRVNNWAKDFCTKQGFYSRKSCKNYDLRRWAELSSGNFSSCSFD